MRLKKKKKKKPTNGWCRARAYSSFFLFGLVSRVFLAGVRYGSPVLAVRVLFFFFFFFFFFSFLLCSHLVQIVAFAGLNAKLFGLAGTRESFCFAFLFFSLPPRLFPELIVPYVYPSQAPFATTADAFESLEFSIARGVFPLLVLGVILLTGITVGRVFCGWACPMGLLQDILIYVPVKKDANWYLFVFLLFFFFSHFSKKSGTVLSPGSVI